MQGAFQVRSSYPEALLVFITPPSAEELERRLSGRGTESAGIVRSRMQRAAEEASYMEEYDYLLINDDAAACARQLHSLIRMQQLRPALQKELIGQIRAELEERREQK